MRILYISGALHQHGGIETYGRELISGLEGRGHAIEIVEADPESVYKDLSVRDFWPSRPFRRRYYFWNRVPYEDYRYHVALGRRVRRAVQSFRPTVVHSLHLHFFGGVVGSRAPVVVSAYGLDVDPSPPVVGSVLASRVVHAISEFTASLVRSRLPPGPDVQVLSWGIRPMAARPPRTADFDLITVSRLVRRKNVDTVLRAIQLVGDLRYAVVGDGPELAALRELARSLGLRQVSFLGAVSEAERSDLLARSRLFVMCPRMEPGDVEGLGLVYFEALGHGLPIVAANNGGVPDAVGTAGLLVKDSNDPAELARAITTALSPATYDQLKDQVRERARLQTWDAFLARFEALYAGAADGASADSPPALSTTRK
ncbi:MAG TPA: glycosyltransferase family 4 protein [Vicinamibacterales bacterium]|nr:glycosyltransferase family 4 protein [Vicinamibacterales bacterium]